MKTYELFINGKFVPNGDREMIQVLNPATEEVISEVPKATAEVVEAAVDAAYEAQKSWAKVPPSLSLSSPFYTRGLSQQFLPPEWNETTCGKHRHGATS